MGDGMMLKWVFWKPPAKVMEEVARIYDKFLDVREYVNRKATEGEDPF